MKLFGRKINMRTVKTFGRKLGHTADIIGRKTLNTIDKLAPVASIIATASGHPEIAEGIDAGQSTAHALDKGIRAGVAVATAKKSNLDNRLIEFGDTADNVAQEVNKTNALLRQ